MRRNSSDKHRDSALTMRVFRKTRHAFQHTQAVTLLKRLISNSSIT